MKKKPTKKTKWPRGSIIVTVGKHRVRIFDDPATGFLFGQVLDSPKAEPRTSAPASPMKSLLIIWGLCSAVFAGDPTAKLDALSIGTNIYKNVTLTKRSDTEAIARFDGGVRKVDIRELPEPLRSEWFSAEDVRRRKEAEESERRASNEKKLEQQQARKEEDERIRRTISPRPVEKASQPKARRNKASRKTNR